MKTLWDGLEKSEAFSSVNNYLGDGDDSEIRRYQISGRVAKLFDRRR